KHVNDISDCPKTFCPTPRQASRCGLKRSADARRCPTVGICIGRELWHRRHMFRMLGFALACVITLAAQTSATAEDRIRLAVQRTGTLAWELDVIRTHGLDRKLDLAIETIELASTEAGKIALKGGSADLMLSDWLWVARERSLGDNLVFYPSSSTLGAVKPGAWGYQLYDRPFPSFSASNSASLFSKPSPLSVENGMLFGSAQTRNTFGSMSSIDRSGRSTACASTFPDRNIAAAAVQEMHKLKRHRSSLAEFIIDLFSSSLWVR